MKFSKRKMMAIAAASMVALAPMTAKADKNGVSIRGDVQFRRAQVEFESFEREYGARLAPWLSRSGSMAEIKKFFRDPDNLDLCETSQQEDVRSWRFQCREKESDQADPSRGAEPERPEVSGQLRNSRLVLEFVKRVKQRLYVEVRNAEAEAEAKVRKAIEEAEAETRGIVAKEEIKEAEAEKPLTEKCISKRLNEANKSVVKAIKKASELKEAGELEEISPEIAEAEAVGRLKRRRAEATVDRLKRRRVEAEAEAAEAEAAVEAAVEAAEAAAEAAEAAAAAAAAAEAAEAAAAAAAETAEEAAAETVEAAVEAAAAAEAAEAAAVEAAAAAAAEAAEAAAEAAAIRKIEAEVENIRSLCGEVKVVSERAREAEVRVGVVDEEVRIRKGEKEAIINQARELAEESRRQLTAEGILEAAGMIADAEKEKIKLGSNLRLAEIGAKKAEAELRQKKLDLSIAIRSLYAKWLRSPACCTSRLIDCSKLVKKFFDRSGSMLVAVPVSSGVVGDGVQKYNFKCCDFIEWLGIPQKQKGEWRGQGYLFGEEALLEFVKQELGIL